jgi:hypothetical protein
MNIEVFIIKIYIMRNRLTERDLSRIVRRVINEENKVEMSNPCLVKLKKLRTNPTYSKVLKKIKERESLSWWEWYDRLELSLTNEENIIYLEFLKKETEIMKDCNKK